MKNHRVVAALVVALIATSSFALTTERLAKGTITFYPALDGPADVSVSKLTLQPGDGTAWHYHPGYVYVVIGQGTIVEEGGCGEVETFVTGTAFEEIQPPRVHRVRNLSSEIAVLYVTNIVPAGAPGSVNLAAAQCGGPQSVSQCRNHGWMKLEFPRPFKNQGDCVSSVQSELPACDRDRRDESALDRRQ